MIRSRTRAGRSRSALSDERGFVLVFVAIALPALLGLVGLALDGARLLTLDTELANRTDAAALAAASRLDRSDGAIAAARQAALQVANGPDQVPVGLSFRFAATLADLDESPTGTLSDTAGSVAAFVEVRSAPTSLGASLLALVGARPVPVRRRAVAESQFYACDVTPLALCQPDGTAFAASARPGRQYLLRLDGNVVPGSVAVLDRPDAPDARSALTTLASDRPAFCFADGVRRRPAVAAEEFDEAVNVRFDRYTGRAGPIRPDLAAFPPAPIVVGGRHLDTCRSPPGGGDTNPPFAIPRDAAFQGLRPSAPWDAGRGDWASAPALGGTGAPVRTALDEYLLWNHAGGGGVTDRLRQAPTRWDLFLAELGLDRRREGNPVDTRAAGRMATSVPTGGPSTGSFALRRENATPVCYGGGRPATDARRRILYMSVVDCAGLDGGATAERLSRRVAKMFLTEPSDGGATFVEFVAFLRPGDDDGKLRHVAQLVRTD